MSVTLDEAKQIAENVKVLRAIEFWEDKELRDRFGSVNSLSTILECLPLGEREHVVRFVKGRVLIKLRELGVDISND